MTVDTSLPDEKLLQQIKQQSSERYFNELEYYLGNKYGPKLLLDLELRELLETSLTPEQRAAAIELYYDITVEFLARMINELLTANSESISTEERDYFLDYLTSKYTWGEKEPYDGGKPIRERVAEMFAQRAEVLQPDLGMQEAN